MPGPRCDPSSRPRDDGLCVRRPARRDDTIALRRALRSRRTPGVNLVDTNANHVDIQAVREAADRPMWTGAAAGIEAIAKSLAAGGVALVVGSAVSGARELVDGAIRRHRPGLAGGGPVEPAEPSRIAGALDEVGAALGVPAAPADSPAAEPAADPVTGARGWIERTARATR